MKKTILLALPSLMMMACTQEEPIAIVQSSEVIEMSFEEESLQLQKIAKEMAFSNVSVFDMQNFSYGVSLAVENGIDEVFYVKELLGYDSKIVPLSHSQKNFGFTEVFKSSEVEEFYEISNNSNKLMIYWPFHENWDGVSKPVISFTPADYSQQHNIAYYVENEELKTIDVDLDYVKKNPVWIVCLSPIAYNQLPDFNNPNRQNIGETLNIVSRKITTFEKYDRNVSRQVNRDSGGYLEFEYLEAKGSRFLIFVGNSISFKIYREFLLNGVLQECDCSKCNDWGNGHVDNPITVTFTANEYNNGATRNLMGVFLSTFDASSHNLRFCITSITDIGWTIINSSTYPIDPLSFNISNQENIVFDKIYEKNYFRTGENLDSIQHIKWNIFYDCWSGI